jgi:hypothetical protein
MTRHVCLHIVASCFHSHTTADDDEHHEETLNATEDIDDLGDGERNAAGERS